MAEHKSNSGSSTEDRLGNVFKELPPLPEGFKKGLVRWLPIISLLVGIIMLASAWETWRWAHAVENLTVYTNALCNTYGASCGIGSDRLTLWVWVDLLALAVVAVLYILAYSGLRTRNKQGWQYLYYAVWVGVVQAVISLFTDYNGASRFVGGLIGAAIGFYLLFQIREFYTGRKLR